MVFARTPRRILFPAAMAVFVAANVAMAFTTSYGVAMALRIISAAAAASSMPAIFAAAADLSPEDRRGRNMSVLAMAAAGATAFGVPVGVWIASGWGWHATFLDMAAMGLLSGLLIMITFPGVETQPPTPLKEQFAVLAQRRISLAIVGGAVAIAGSLTLVTYVAPYLSETLGRDDMRSIAFLIFGIAATVGTFLGGWQSDARGPDRTIVTGMSLFSVLMVLCRCARRRGRRGARRRHHVRRPGRRARGGRCGPRRHRASPAAGGVRRRPRAGRFRRRGGGFRR